MKPDCVLILSSKTIAAHQVASLVQLHGHAAVIVEADLQAYQTMETSHIRYLVTDIDDVSLNGMAVGRWWQSIRKHAPWYAMCKGGNTPVMRNARAAGTCGFFFLNPAGVAIDPERGMARALLAEDPTSRVLSRDVRRQRQEAAFSPLCLRRARPHCLHVSPYTQTTLRREQGRPGGGDPVP